MLKMRLGYRFCWGTKGSLFSKVRNYRIQVRAKLDTAVIFFNSYASKQAAEIVRLSSFLFFNIYIAHQLTNHQIPQEKYHKYHVVFKLESHNKLYGMNLLCKVWYS